MPRGRDRNTGSDGSGSQGAGAAGNGSENGGSNNGGSGNGSAPVAGAIEPIEIQEEMERSFLEYSMSVIVARALPDVRDGLKPVHRRILYSMEEQRLLPDRPRSKCAKVVGEVMGTYHPHGDLAIYDALARMAQDFSLRHMLIDGHGSFGGRAPDDSPAAMRYTECRLASLALELLAGDRRGHRRLHSQLRRFDRRASGAPFALSEPTRERLAGNRGRNGDEHPPAQSR